LLVALASGCATKGTTDYSSSVGVEPRAAEDPKEIAARATVVTIVPEPARGEDVVCTKQPVTGSHRARTICATRDQSRATRAAAQDWIRSGGRAGEISRVPTVR
jgi:hypothetical protein